MPTLTWEWRRKEFYLTFPFCTPSPIYCRYIDGTLMRVNAKENLQVLKDASVANSYLNFNCERSSGVKLPLLDAEVQQDDDQFHTKVYVKPTNIGFCLSGDSECSQRYKDRVINTFMRRVNKHCSTWANTHQGLEQLS